MVFTKDRPLGPGRSILMFIVVECQDHSAIQAPRGKAIDIDHSNNETTVYHSSAPPKWALDGRKTSCVACQQKA